MAGIGMNDMAAIDLPYIERNVSRHGRTRYYFRFDGKRIARLPDDPQSEEFTKRYWEARNSLSAPLGQTEAIATLPRIAPPGTFHFLCAYYLGSEAYKSLDRTTRDKRAQIIDSMLHEPITPGDARIFAQMPIGVLDVGNLTVLRDRKQHAPFAADERLKVLRQIFDVGTKAKPSPLVKQNTAKLVDPYRKKTEGHATLRNDDIAIYIQHHGPNSKAVLALSILMYTGIRVSDLALIGPRHRRGNTLTLRMFKNRNRSPVTLELPIHPILDGILELHAPYEMFYLTTEYGKPFSIKGLSQRVSEWFSQANLPSLTAHSVRKGLATNIAENEATDLMLESFFGWKDQKTSRIYTRNAQRSRLARQAILKIDWGEMGNVLPHPNEASGSG